MKMETEYCEECMEDVDVEVEEDSGG